MTHLFTTITVSPILTSIKLVSTTTLRSPRVRCLRRKGSMNSFPAATSAMTHLFTTFTPTVVPTAADHSHSPSITAKAPSVTSTRTHFIKSVPEAASRAMEAFAVVNPTTVAALRATARHPTEVLVDLADSEKLTSRQKIQT